MGMYVLAGLEENKNLKSDIFEYLSNTIIKRQNYAQNLTEGPDTCELINLILLHIYYNLMFHLF